MLQSDSPLFVDKTTGRPLKFVITRGKHRPEIRALVEEHGGVVAQNDFEEDVFMKLTGPDVNNPTRGWYSTEYVRDCIDQGMLLDQQQYDLLLKNKPTGRSTLRNHYSAGDEQILRDHIKNAKHTSGFKLYDELHQLFPHHSAQSWRDHALKILPALQKGANGKFSAGAQRKPRRPALTAHEAAVLRETLLRAQPDEREAIYNVIGLTFTAPPRTPEIWAEHGTDTLAAADKNGHFEGPDVPHQIAGIIEMKRKPFTVSEKQLLREANQRDEREIRDNAASYWKAFATKHPSHPWEGWKEHYKKKMLPVFEDAKKILMDAAKWKADHLPDDDELLLPPASQFLGYPISRVSIEPSQHGAPPLTAEAADSESDEPAAMTQAPGHHSDVPDDERPALRPEPITQVPEQDSEVSDDDENSALGMEPMTQAPGNESHDTIAEKPTSDPMTQAPDQNIDVSDDDENSALGMEPMTQAPGNESHDTMAEKPTLDPMTQAPDQDSDVSDDDENSAVGLERMTQGSGSENYDTVAEKPALDPMTQAPDHDSDDSNVEDPAIAPGPMSQAPEHDSSDSNAENLAVGPRPMTQAPSLYSDISEDEKPLHPVWEVRPDSSADSEDSGSAIEAPARTTRAIDQLDPKNISPDTSECNDDSVGNSQEASAREGSPALLTQCISAVPPEDGEEVEHVEANADGNASADNDEAIPLIGATEQELEEMLEIQAMRTRSHKHPVEDDGNTDGTIENNLVETGDSAQVPPHTQPSRGPSRPAVSVNAAGPTSDFSGSPAPADVPSAPKRFRETSDSAEVPSAKRPRRVFSSVDVPRRPDRSESSRSSVARSQRLASAQIRDRYLSKFDRMCADFDENFTRQECAAALHASSGNFARARILLEANFEVGDIADTTIRQSIFLPADDDIIMTRDEEAVATLAERKGPERVAERQIFLEQYTYAGSQLALCKKK
ncbi:hypothetical protein HDU86_004983 [Geranomyces michiganensis]|nr:hypothetical protein HDU86_004983 [Geranomyces michiganensis]